MILREVNRVGEGKKNVPKLRFKGYEDAWEQRKLGDIADRFDNLRVPISAADRIPGETPYYGANGIQDYVDGYTHDGEFLLVAEDGANDLEDYPVNYVNGKIWVNNHAHVIQSKSDISINSFLMYAIKQIKMNQFIVGGSRAKLNSEVMISLPITIPDIKEQLFIGDYFQGIDNLITLHQRKYDALKTMKKTLLSKMFPKDGEEVPEIRFKGFTDAWEQRKLGALVQFVNGRAYKQEELLDVGKYKVVRVGNFNTNEKWYFSDLELETDKYMDNGDLLYLWATSFGPVIWQGEKAIFHYHIWKLKNFENLDKKYLYSFLEWDKNKISQNTNGSTMVHITKNMIEQRDIEYPTKSEQYRIGSLLERVDNLITLHQRRSSRIIGFSAT